jgi:tryptophan halogenase
MKIKELCIVGGGTSGWMLAVAMQKYNADIEITLIESDKVGSIGVGESTIPVVSNFIKQFLGFDEKDWMPNCDAVYKASIKFNNFKNKDHVAYHPFWSHEERDMSGFDWSIKNKLKPNSTKTEDYYNAYYIACLMSKKNKFSPSSRITHAHHLDATKFGLFCKEQCKSVKHIVGHITNVIVEDEHIQELQLEDGTTIEADLFVDCTGFSAMLIGEALDNEFISTGDYLLNDKAIFSRIEYDDNKEGEIQPYTDCTALSSGWAWNIPLWSRSGTGYVYSSKYLSEEEAKEEFYNYLVDRFDEDRVSKDNFNVINIKAGKYKKSWINNCTSLVLSSGFVEPLESTGLALMVKQVEHLVDTVKDGHYNRLDIENYNHFVTRGVQEVVDFVSLHYYSTNRTDTPYWKYINQQISIPNTLTDRLSKIDNNQFDNTEGEYFPLKSWESILIGFGVTTSSFYKGKGLKYLNIDIDSMDEEEQNRTLEYTSTFLREKTHKNQQATDKMLSHFSYLKKTIYKEL